MITLSYDIEEVGPEDDRSIVIRFRVDGKESGTVEETNAAAAFGNAAVILMKKITDEMGEGPSTELITDNREILDQAINRLRNGGRI